MFYGCISLVLAVIIQPFYDLGFPAGIWMIIDIVCCVFLILAGFICKNIEKARALNSAKIAAEMEMYRKKEESFRSQMVEEDALAKRK